MPASQASTLIKRVLDAGDDLYAVLGADASSDRAAIEEAFKQAVPYIHPRSCTEAGATRAFAKMLEAFCVLGDETLRRGYDQHGLQGVGQALQAFKSGSVLQQLEVKLAKVDAHVVAIVNAGASDDLYGVLGLDSKLHFSYSQEDIDRAFTEAECKVLAEGSDVDETLVIVSIALNKLLEAYYVLGDAQLRQRFAHEGSKMISNSMRAVNNGANLIQKLRARAKGEQVDDNDLQTRARNEAIFWDWQMPAIIVLVAAQIAVFLSFKMFTAG